MILQVTVALSHALSSGMRTAFAVIAVALCFSCVVTVEAERELIVALELVDVMYIYMYYTYVCVCVCVCFNSTVSLTPSGNISVCYNDSVSLICITKNGPTLWVQGSSNHLFNSLQDPVMLGNLLLNVTSVNLVNGASVKVTSTATIEHFQLNSSGLTVECQETTSMISSQTTLKLAGK